MRVGIFGGGQLGRMLALAGHPIGVQCVAYTQGVDDPACGVGAYELGAWEDLEALDRFASRIDVATFEFEHVSLDAVRRVASGVPVRPSIETLRIASDRLEEKTLFRSLGIDTAPFASVDSEADLRAAVAAVGLPAVLKTRRFGYDGKGQRVLHSEADVDGAFTALGGVPCLLERFVTFDRELSILGARGVDGSVVFYPLIENVHRGGILRISIAPAPRSERFRATAEDALRALFDRLDYVGVLALEFFQDGERLLANEMAPRVHNSGHFTIEGCETSQFENHLRAIVGWPLGTTAMRGYAAMVNLIGSLPDCASVLAVPGAHLHLYGKRPQPGRKLGHVTVRADDERVRDRALAEIVRLVGEDPGPWGAQSRSTSSSSMISGQ